MAARHRLFSSQLSSLSSFALPWLPVLAGIGVVAGFMIYGVTLNVGEQAGFQVPPSPGPVVELSPSAPDTPPPPSDPPGTSAPPPTSDPPPTTDPPPAHPPPTHPPATSAPPPDVVGAYHLVASFDHEFIGKVVIANTSHHARDWTARLAFPANVGKVLAFWVDGEWQPEGRRLEDNSVVFTSTAPLAAQSHTALKIKFARSGEDVDPDLCTVNDTPCQDG